MRCCQLTVVKSGFLTGLSHHNTRQRSIHTAYSQQDRRVLTHRLMRTQVSTHMGAFRPPAYCHATAAKSVVSVMFTVTAMYCAGPSLREPSFSHDYCSSHPHGTESAMDRQVSVVFRTPSSSHIPTQHPHTSIIHSQPLQPHFTSWASQSPTWPQE